MKRIGVLNLTRFGDLIQTTPVLSGLRKRHPEAEIHLIVKTRFREVAEMLPGIDEIHEVDGDALARLMMDPGSAFLDAFRAVRDIADELGCMHFDVLFNFTHSRTSAVLLSLLDADHRVGFDLDRQGFRRVEDPWLQHMSSIVRARRVTRFNLVDMYLGAAGLVGCGEALRVHIPPRARAFAAERLPAGVPLVAVQLGASSDTKAWAVARYAETLNALARTLSGLRVVLVGLPAEKSLALGLQGACPGVKFEDLVGETHVTELAGIIERCNLLLTGDTGTMHLAGAVGTVTCALFVGLGNPWETAVYADGHWALMSRLGCAPCHHFVKCGFPACHGDVPGEWLAELVVRILRGDPPEALPLLPRADLLRTAFDDHGLLDLLPVHRRAARPFDLMGLVFRAVFLESMGRIPLALQQIWSEAERRYGTPPGEWARFLPEDIVGSLHRLEAIAQRAELAARQLERARANPEGARRAGDLLKRCDDEAFEIARSEPLLGPLGLSLETALESFSEADLPALARRSADEYALLRRRAALVRDVIEPVPTRDPSTREGVAG
ncbi:MAG: glycosyltransferase family 9 protein [Myxococcota bacterium]